MAFFFEKDDECGSFLVWMEEYMGDMYEHYLTGFFAGLSGKFPIKYRYLKDDYVTTDEEANNVTAQTALIS